jgi:hypothetical protein
MKQEKETFFKYNSVFLQKQKKLVHGFCTREGGVSTDPHYKSLNCNPFSLDDPKNVKDNKAIICERLGFKNSSLKTINQTHSDKVITLNDASIDTSSLQADALVTNLPNLLLGIQTADCVPILFFEPQNRIIAATHAGWKGAFSGIIENTILAMQELGAMTPAIIAAIGPCIQQFSYEVDLNFYIKFIELNPSNFMFFVPSETVDHYMFDLPGYCMHRLRKLGLLKVENLGIDTYSNPNLLFSFRRATHENSNPDERPKYGNQLSVIGLLN